MKKHLLTKYYVPKKANELVKSEKSMYVVQLCKQASKQINGSPGDYVEGPVVMPTFIP